jgi:hypothetical protein
VLDLKRVILVALYQNRLFQPKLDDVGHRAGRAHSGGPQRGEPHELPQPQW